MKKSVSIPFVWAASFLVIFAGVAVLGFLDIGFTLRTAAVREGLQAFSTWLVAGIVAGVTSGLVVALVTWPLRNVVSRRQLVGALAGLAVQLIAVLMLSPLRVAATLPVAWLFALGLSRFGQLDHIGNLVAVCLATVLTLGGALTVLQALQLPIIAWALAMIVVAAAAWLTQQSAIRKPRWTIGAVGALAGCATVVVIGVLSLAGTEPSAFAKARPTGIPNVVLIVLDTTRRDHIGVYGHPGKLTPNFDRLAQESTIYDQAISPAEWTVPSHASMFTGLYPATHGASFAHHRWLDDRFVTLAEMLKREGYQTAGLVANYYATAVNLQQGMDHFVWVDSPAGLLVRSARTLGAPQRWADKGGAHAVDELLRWLHGQYDSTKPFFLFVNLVDPHEQYLPPVEQRAAHLPDGMSYLQATSIVAHFHLAELLAGKPLTPAEKRALRGMYAAEIAYLDVQLGRILAILRDAVDLDNTLLIITADHGENLGEAGRWSHHFAVNDHLVRVPLIIRYPARFPPGLRITGQCQTIDLVPTVYDVLGRKPPIPDLPGRSLIPEKFKAWNETFIEAIPFYNHFAQMSPVTGMKRDISKFTHILRAVRTDRYKYVWSSDGEEQLYDLQNDPDEVVNVRAQHPDEAAALRERLQAWWQSVPKYQAQLEPTTPAAAPLSPAERERLRMLGYAQ